MRIAICEDKTADAAEVRSYLERYLEQNAFMSEIDVFDSGESLLEAFSPGLFDIIFLDIYLGETSGMEAARQIRAADPDCILVFITVAPGYMPEGFALRAAAYVVKPITKEQMDTALLQCRRIFLKNARFIEVKTGGQKVKIPLPKIRYVEMQNKVATIYLGDGADGAIKTYTPMDEIERQLGGRPFLRCHRACIVNLNYVQDILENDFLMIGGARAPIRKNGMKEIRRIVSDYFSERLFEDA